MMVFVFKRKTAYEMRISDWSSDVFASDLGSQGGQAAPRRSRHVRYSRQGPGDAHPCRDKAYPPADELGRGEGAARRRQEGRLRRHGIHHGARTRRSEERLGGKEWSVRVELGGRRKHKKKKKNK